jgi:hypothetical protein
MLYLTEAIILLSNDVDVKEMRAIKLDHKRRSIWQVTQLNSDRMQSNRRLLTFALR